MSTVDRNDGKTEETPLIIPNRQGGITPLPFQIPEILDVVLRLMSLADLKNCRQVNTQWENLSSRILQSRTDICIKIASVSEARDFHRITINKQLTMVPCQNYILDAKLPFFTEFNCFRHFNCMNIKRLTVTNFLSLDSCIRDSLCISFYSFLFHDLPNLEYLEIDHGRCTFETKSFEKCWDPSRSLNKAQGASPLPAKRRQSRRQRRIQLFNLKECKFSFKSSFGESFAPFIKGVINAAPNLQILEAPMNFGLLIGGWDGISSGIIENLLDSGRVGMIKEITLDFQFAYWKHITLLERFADGNPKLRAIHIHLHHSAYLEFHIPYTNYWNRLGECLSKIFDSSAATLENVSVDPLGFLERFYLPARIPKVQQLSIIVKPYSSKLFQNNENLDEVQVTTTQFQSSNHFSNETFPVLKNVTIEWEKSVESDHAWESSFGDCSSSCNSVSQLTLKHVSCDGSWLPRLSQLFPNVTELRVNSMHASNTFQMYARKLFSSFANVKHLVVTDICDEKIWRDASYLDSCLTGFSLLTCRKLLNHERLRSQGEDVPPVCIVALERIRFYPSVLTLKNLKTFRLSLDSHCEYESNFSLKAGRRPNISVIAKERAIDHHPHLKL